MPRIDIRVPSDLYLVEHAFAEYPDILALCGRIDTIYLLRCAETLLSPDEIRQVELVCRALLKRIDPLKITPRPRFVIKHRRLQPRFSLIFQPSFEAHQLVQERLGPILSRYYDL